MPLELNGYSAHICCDGKELETYDVRVEDEKTINCWIPSEEGKAFTVHWGDDSSSTTMIVKVTMDGRKVGQTAHQPAPTGSREGVRETSGTLRPFMFAPLVLTEDDALLDNRVNEDLGTIEIEMKLVQGFSESKEFCAVYVPEIGPMHERSKKAAVHAVALGQPREVKPVEFCSTYGADKVPFATFKFRYRPLELLQANGVAPLPERPATLNKRPLGDLDKLDSAGPSSRKRRHTEPAAVIKPEAEDDNDDDDMQFLEEQLQMMQRRVEEARAAKKAKNAVKREVSPICIPSSDSDDIIDLT